MSSNRIDPSIISPDIAYRTGVNFITETFDRRNTNGTTTYSTQQLRAGAAPIIEGDTVSNLACFSTIAGTAVTLFKLGVYDRSFNLVASTTDVKAGLGTNNWIIGTTTPWTAPYTGIIYLANLVVFTTTTPTLIGSNTGFAGNEPPASGLARISWSQTGLADLPAVATPGSGSLIPYIFAS